MLMYLLLFYTGTWKRFLQSPPSVSRWQTNLLVWVGSSQHGRNELSSFQKIIIIVTMYHKSNGSHSGLVYLRYTRGNILAVTDSIIVYMCFLENIYYVQVISILLVFRITNVWVKESVENFGEPVDVCMWGSVAVHVAVHCPCLLRVCCVPCVSRAESVFSVFCGHSPTCIPWSCLCFLLALFLC